MGNIYIYTLSDPNTKTVHYVGMTRKINDRYTCHLSEGRRHPEQNRKNNWIHCLLKLEQKPIMTIIEVCGYDWEERETFWIKYFREKEGDLFNIAEGGLKMTPPGFVAMVEHPVELEEQVWDFLRRLKKKTGLPVAEHIRRAIDEYLKRMERE